VIEGGGERPPERHEVAQLHRGELAPDTLGLKLEVVPLAVELGDGDPLCGM
jgi:hypothetical protein